MSNLKRRVFFLFLFLLLCVIASLFAAPALVGRAAQGKTFSDVALIPHRTVGLLLGCNQKLGDGSNNPFFDTRIAAAATLFHAGKVDYLLVSGDNSRRNYDEATEMRNGLLQAGVPAERIYCDCAGFRTLDSIVRAREVFGLTQATVISQEFHNQRAIFLASHRGLDAIGFNAQDADLNDVAGVHKREKLAKVKAMLDMYVLRRTPHFLGARVSIGKDAPTICSAAQ